MKAGDEPKEPARSWTAAEANAAEYVTDLAERARGRACYGGMTNRWLLDQGLVFLRYLWGELAPLRRTA